MSLLVARCEACSEEISIEVSQEHRQLCVDLLAETVRLHESGSPKCQGKVKTTIEPGDLLPLAGT